MSNRQLFSIGLILAAYATATISSAAEQNKPEAVEIPLKDIWAYEMSGTRDVRELEPDKFGPKIQKLSSAEQVALSETSLTTQILTPLERNKPGQTAIQAFAVTGTGADALRRAAEVLSGKKKSQTSFPANSEVTVVFFSYLYGSYVHLNKVEQQPGLISITYRFVSHETANLTRHFALIPLGKLPSGEVQVDIQQMQAGQKITDDGIKGSAQSVESQIVSRSFRFNVKKKGD